MTSFRNFLAEELDETKLKHLEHAEDHVINAGHEGFSHAYHNLKDVHDRLTGKKNDTRITMKYDGSPSVVFGRHPETGRFFVASKSAFNKNPKINYTHEDIERNHGHAPGLVSKLRAALQHLPKVTPKKGVFQGDIMHTSEDVHESDGRVHFTPNTITYSAPKNSAHGKAASNSKIGVAIHTKYNGKNLEDMQAEHGAQLHDFGLHKDVHLISTEHHLDNIKFTPQNRERFAKAMTAAAAHNKKAKDVLAKTLSSSAEFDHSINGKKSKPEGFVVVRHNRPTKIVDRAEFSAANFNKVKAQ